MAFKVRFNDKTEETFSSLAERNEYEAKHGVWAKSTTEIDDETPIRIARESYDKAGKALRKIVLEALAAGEPIFIKKSGSLKRNGGILGDSQLGAGAILEWFKTMSDPEKGKDDKGKEVIVQPATWTGEYTKEVKIPGTNQTVKLTDAQVQELTGLKREGRADFGKGK